MVGGHQRQHRGRGRRQGERRRRGRVRLRALGHRVVAAAKSSPRARPRAASAAPSESRATPSSSARTPATPRRAPRMCSCDRERCGRRRRSCSPPILRPTTSSVTRRLPRVTRWSSARGATRPTPAPRMSSFARARRGRSSRSSWRAMLRRATRLASRSRSTATQRSSARTVRQPTLEQRTSTRAPDRLDRANEARRDRSCNQPQLWWGRRGQRRHRGRRRIQQRHDRRRLRVRTAGTAWSFKTKLVPLDALAGDHLGYSAAISGDVAAFGAYGKNSPTGDVSAGAAYVFTFRATNGDACSAATSCQAASAPTACAAIKRASACAPRAPRRRRAPAPTACAAPSPTTPTPTSSARASRAPSVPPSRRTATAATARARAASPRRSHARPTSATARAGPASPRAPKTRTALRASGAAERPARPRRHRAPSAARSTSARAASASTRSAATPHAPVCARPASAHAPAWLEATAPAPVADATDPDNECGGATCSAGTLAKSVCDGKSGCRAETTSCGFACETASKCRTTCTEDAHCLPGHRCADGACIETTLAVCTQDRSASIGTTGASTPCGAYTCDPATGLCATVCESNNDCSLTNVCSSSHVCGPASTTAEDTSSCAFAGPSRASDDRWIIVALAGVVVLSRKRRKSAIRYHR